MYHHEKSRVYVITYLPTGKKYVGRTTNLKDRIQLHMSALRCGRHSSKELQKDYNKFGGGKDAFRIEVVGEYQWHVNKVDTDLEFLVMTRLHTYDEQYGYNTHDPAMQLVRRAEGLSPIYAGGRKRAKSNVL